MYVPDIWPGAYSTGQGNHHMQHPTVKLLLLLLLVLAVGLAGGFESVPTSMVLPANAATTSAPADETPLAREPASRYRSTVEVVSCSKDQTTLRFEFVTNPTGRDPARQRSPRGISSMPAAYVRTRSASPEREGSFSWRVASASPGPFTLLVQIPNTGTVGVEVAAGELECRIHVRVR